jgi:hypothetical protein
VVVTKAAQSVGLLAKGLRQDFASEGKQLVGTLLNKFKERKATVVAALHESLEHMMNVCFGLVDIIEGTKVIHGSVY